MTPIGPGGGEPAGTVPAGFRATSEVFVDPTSGQRDAGLRRSPRPARGAMWPKETWAPIPAPARIGPADT